MICDMPLTYEYLLKLKYLLLLLSPHAIYYTTIRLVDAKVVSGTEEQEEEESNRRNSIFQRRGQYIKSSSIPCRAGQTNEPTWKQKLQLREQREWQRKD